MDEPQPKSRVSRLHVGRVYNLGNYENMRVEVTVEVGTEDDPARLLRSLEGILDDLRAEGPEEWYLSRARRALEKPESEMDEDDRKQLDKHREVIAQHEDAMRRRAAARAALSTLNYNCERRDAKDDWDDEDR
ncbi:MAG: hypothetical protein M3416_03820 [Acidobacteriota bacterium]|nr:hypothetical protein [Acidobacteriota bacterium]